jgi:hypothetical protein
VAPRALLRVAPWACAWNIVLAACRYFLVSANVPKIGALRYARLSNHK